MHLASWFLLVVTTFSSNDMVSFAEGQNWPTYKVGTPVYKKEADSWVEGTIEDFNETNSKYTIWWKGLSTTQLIDIAAVEKFVKNKSAVQANNLIEQGEYEDVIQEQDEEDALMNGHVDYNPQDVFEEEDLIDGQESFPDGTMVSKKTTDGFWMNGKILNYLDRTYEIEWANGDKTTVNSDDSIDQMVSDYKLVNIEETV
eukprot:CAMPEP_0201126882 /NCGR_PEP_ID=MMETSP0850-20130426/27863_1 /ASSEMBLY_ACC=CAM_ASM_000622 /TAXON_ID=183588 /ORGANISM="Pseudo-nitzschia fraudulenta, Strain WWA7" /LENGTH=199 /DNA_ID=CAMNT_0047395503 /DNA_START=144 /DNA_END=743 /DNA_ORIENTATION=-